MYYMYMCTLYPGPDLDCRVLLATSLGGTPVQVQTGRGGGGGGGGGGGPCDSPN